MNSSRAPGTGTHRAGGSRKRCRACRRWPRCGRRPPPGWPEIAAISSPRRSIRLLTPSSQTGARCAVVRDVMPPAMRRDRPRRPFCRPEPVRRPTERPAMPAPTITVSAVSAPLAAVRRAGPRPASRAIGWPPRVRSRHPPSVDGRQRQGWPGGCRSSRARWTRPADREVVVPGGAMAPDDSRRSALRRGNRT